MNVEKILLIIANKRYGAHSILSFLSNAKLSFKIDNKGVDELIIFFPRMLKEGLKNMKMESFY